MEQARAPSRPVSGIQREEGRPETFDFLGFTHYCRATRNGRFGLGRKPVTKRVNRTLRAVNEGLPRRMHADAMATGRWLGRVLRGWLGYLRCRRATATCGSSRAACNACGYGLPDGGRSATAFRGGVCTTSGGACGPASPSSIRGLRSDLPLPTQGRSRMRERARPDLCRGRRATGVPTAIFYGPPPAGKHFVLHHGPWDSTLRCPSTGTRRIGRGGSTRMLVFVGDDWSTRCPNGGESLAARRLPEGLEGMPRVAR